MAGRVREVKITDKQKRILEEIITHKKTIQTRPYVRTSIAIRAKIILLTVEGKSTLNIGKEVKSNKNTAILWQNLWNDASTSLKEIEDTGDDDQLRAAIYKVLTYYEADGRPLKFTTEQTNKILALACGGPVVPEKSIAKWSLSILTKKILEQGIVKNISASTVKTILERHGVIRRFTGGRHYRSSLYYTDYLVSKEALKERYEND